MNEHEVKIVELQNLVDALSGEINRSQEFYLRNVMKLRWYLRCLLLELENMPDHKSYSNHLYKVKLGEIRKESRKVY